MMSLWNIRKLLFSEECIICGKVCDDNNIYLCYNCQKSMKYQSAVKVLKDNFYYIWDYNSIYSKVILKYKYANVKNIKEIISGLVKEKIFYILEKEAVDYIIPVPIHKKRRALRGFNQTEEILNAMNLKYINIKRSENTKAMYKLLDEQKRKLNIHGSFKLETKINFNGKNILIFDDIITTGTTVEEIIRVIKKSYKVNKCIVFSMMAANTIKKYNGGR